MIAKLPLLNFARVRIQFPLMPMGVLATGSAHPRPSARLPIDMRTHMQSFGTIRQLLIFFLSNLKTPPKSQPGEGQQCAGGRDQTRLRPLQTAGISNEYQPVQKDLSLNLMKFEIKLG